MPEEHKTILKNKMPEEHKTILTNNKKNNSKLNSHGHIMCFGLILCIILVMMIITYFIMGVIYLHSEFNLWKVCSKTNYLWPWILVSMLSVFNKCNLKPIQQFPNKSFFWLSFIYEICLTIWGGIELFLRCYKCKEILKSPLWDFGVATFIIESIILILYLKIIYNEINPIKNQKKDTETVKFVSFAQSISLNSFGDNPLSEV